VSDWDLIHRFSNDYLTDSEDVAYLQEASTEQGIQAISRTLGSSIAAIARAVAARSIIEVGTGVGVTTMRLAEATPDAHITSIDSEADHHVTLRELLPQVGLETSSLRLITERAQDVLGKMNENSYDLVVFDVPAGDVEACFGDAVALCRPGGSILITRALAGGAIADAASREPRVTAMRAVVKMVAQDDRVTHTLLPMAEGLLWAQVHTNDTV
jgi:predicted O-methyltransferase YrrM